MSDPPATPPRGGGSALRLIAGMTLLIAAFGTAVFGFFRLTSVLDQGGYGTAAMRNALIMLGAAGACLAAGVSTIIWDIAKRFER